MLGTNNIDKMDKSSPLDRIINNIKEKTGLYYSKEDLKSIFNERGVEYRTSQVHFRTPHFIFDFIKQIVLKKPIKTVLDPFTQNDPVSSVFNQIDFESMHLYKPITKNWFGDIYFNHELTDKIEFIEGRFPSNITEYQNYDCILTSPVFGMKKQKSEVKYQGRKIELFDDDPHLLVATTCQLLSEQGIGIFIVSPSFFTKNNKRGVFQNLNEIGLNLDAVFEIPTGAFHPWALIQTNIIIISKNIQENTFIGQVSDSIKENQQLLSNYFAGKTDKTFRKGTLVSTADFLGVSNEIQKRESELFLKRFNAEIKPFNEIIKSKEVIRSYNDESDIDNKSNYLIIPLSGIGDVYASITDKGERLKNFIVLELVHDEANSRYFEYLLNSNFGKKLRQSITTGSTIQHTSVADICNIRLPVPDKKEQDNIVFTLEQLDFYKSELERLKSDYWSKHVTIAKTEKVLKSIIKKPKEYDWLEHLPFPLASILWGYYSKTEINKKFEYLILFYEALAEFLVVVAFSGFSKKYRYFKSVSPAIFEEHKNYVGWYLKSSFGGWTNLLLRIAKNIRKLKPDQREVMISSFGNPNEDFINLLSSNEIPKVLNEIAFKRNDWKGHTGIVSDNDYQLRVNWLNELMQSIKTNLVDGFEKSDFIIPTERMQFQENMFKTTVKNLTGTRSQFSESEVFTIEPLEQNNIYIIHENQVTPLKLLPLVKMMPSPRTEMNACYFYNRVDKGRIRMVSYHFEQESEVYINEVAIHDSLKLFSSSE